MERLKIRREVIAASTLLLITVATLVFGVQPKAVESAGLFHEYSDSVKILSVDEHGEWPMFHHDERNTGFSDFETAVEVLTEPHLIWSYDLPGTVYGSPVVADVDRDGKKEILIDNGPPGTTANGGCLYCLNESGEVLWTFMGYYDPDPARRAWGFSTPAIGDVDQNGFDEILYWSKSAYWPDYLQALHCLEPNGTERWSSNYNAWNFPMGAVDYSIPTIGNITGGNGLETVVQYAVNYELFCHNSAGRIWTYYYNQLDPYPMGDVIRSQTASAIADLDHDGLGEIVVSVGWYPPSSYEGAVFCLDSTGNLLWIRQDIVPITVEAYPSSSGCSPVVEDLEGNGRSEILIGSSNATTRGMWCLNETGGTVWYYPMSSQLYTTAAVADVDNDGAKEIVFGADDGYVYCLNSTGALKWRYKTGDKVRSSAAIADIEKPPGGQPRQMEIVVGSLDGKLYCLNSIGQLLWTYNAGAPIYSSPAIVDLQYSGEGTPDIIFAASNKLYALRITPAHDIAVVNISPYKNAVGQGYNLPTQVTINNKGSYPENFNVTVYANTTEIQTITVIGLNPYASTVLAFEWNTTDFLIGNYIIKAVANVVPEEYHTVDNMLVDGTVTIESTLHDVAITNVHPSQTLANEGSSVDISVSAENQGNMRETFNVTVFANETEIQRKTVSNMDFGTAQILDFVWNTTGFPLGNYTIHATADIVHGETQTEDNTYVDGTVSMLGRTCVLVEPSTTKVWPNQTFTIDIRVCNVIDLYAWQVQLNFNSTVLEWISGGRLSSDGSVSYFRVGLNPPSTGNYSLFTVTFKGTTEGISSLHIDDSSTILVDSNQQQIPYSPLDGVAKVVQHDVALSKVTPSKNIVGSGRSANINVTVENKGCFTETFNVTVYADTTITNQTELTLTVGDSTNISFNWNTTGFAYGNYTISAYAEPVPGEIDITDNSQMGGTVYVGIPGDIKGDGIVNVLDAIVLGNHFLESPRSLGWNQGGNNADINGDNVVNILDAIILGNHFLEHYP